MQFALPILHTVRKARLYRSPHIAWPRLQAFLARARSDAQGLTFVEFALMMPVLLALFFGGVEVTRFILINQKLTKLADGTADMITQGQTISRTEIDQVLSAVGDIMRPYSFATTDAVIFTTVSRTGTNPVVVNWQYPSPATYGKTSRIGSPGGNATLPSTLTLVDRESVVIAEVFYQFTPISPIVVVPAQQVYKASYFKPRLGALTTLN